jgi:hypothetical protein
VQDVQQPGVDAPRRVGRRAERLRERVGGGEADPLDLGHRVGVDAQRLDRRRPERAVDPRRGGGRDAVALEEHPHRPQRALLLPRAHRRPDPRAPDPGHLAQRPAGVAVDRGEHLLGAVALEQPRRTANADVLDRGQVGQQRGLALGLAHAHPLDGELRPVLGMPAPRAPDVDRLAGVDVGERAGQHDLVALVADAVQHGEVALLEGVAHRRHLHRQLLHVAAP